MKIEDIVVVEDKRGNKHFVKGSINGIAIKQVRGKRKKSGRIIGLDSDWVGRKILCILLEGENEV